MKIRVLRLLLIFLSTIFNVRAQVSIDLPVSNSVFQRSAGDETDLYIAGAYLNPIVTSVQARLVIPSTSTPVSGFDWTIIESNPSKGKYFGQLSSVPTGWYTLEVRLVNTGSVLRSSFVDRVGVGDVYLAFGQSNAQGLSGSGEVSAVSEKVISHNYIDSCSQETPPFPSLSKIVSGSNVGQHGLGSWIYGRLGDNLVTENGVPVAFFNAATSGASLTNFLASSMGNPTNHPFTGSQVCMGINPSFPSGVGSPYGVFTKTIQYYNSIFGIRAILWHQGESETALGTSLSNTYNRLDSIIDITRNDFGKNINWVVSRASYINNETSPNVITAQNNIINTSNKVFSGPFTDDVIGDKREASGDVHFINSGLITVADKWSTALFTEMYSGNTESFYDLSVPYESNAIPEIETSISGNNVSLTAPLGYTSYKWVNGDNFDSPVVDSDRFYTATSGTVRCYMTLSNNNIVFSPAVNISNLLSQQSISTAYVDSLYLSDYTPYSILNGLGPVSFDQSVGSSGDGDGSLMEINGISYPKGIGTHSGSETVYKMPTGFSSRFKASIGIDDDSFSGASVKFKVYGEDTLIYTSSFLTHTSNAINIDVNIAGYSSIKLVVENSGGTLATNQANWANARIIYDSPKNLSLSVLSTKCLELNWTAANDLNGIVSYKLFKNNVFQSSVPAGTLTYKFNGLVRKTAYTLSVKAIDVNGYESSKIDTVVSTVQISILYTGDLEVCIGDNATPISNISGGTYKLISKPDSVTFSLSNPSTGEVIFGSDGYVLLRYVWGGGGSCADSANFYLRGIRKPTPPNISTSTNILINKGQRVSFSSTACVSPYVLEWQNTSTASTLMASPTDTSSYFAFCKNSNCYSGTSNTIKVNVIPDCPNSFTLVSFLDDINYSSSSFNFFASTSIKASHKIFNPSGAIFKAGQKITLNPGFEIKAGSVFSATIGGCP